MHLLLFLIVISISHICHGSNFNPDYPNFRICVISEAHGSFKTPAQAYEYLKHTLGLGQRCTHIYGNLPINDLGRFKNGSDPDLSFLESIVEISGSLSIYNNYVRRIPLTNLKVIRGVTLRNESEALKIIHNHSKNETFLEELDLRNLRAIMTKNVIISQNPGLEYLEKNLDWRQIFDDPTIQKLKVSEYARTSNYTAKCHEECQYWTGPDNVKSQFCFGPSKNECQKQTKCVTNKDLKWCRFTETAEIPCNHECAGGCEGRTSKDCTVCNKLFKNSDCVSSCSPQPNHIFGMDSKDKLRYTVGGLCTSQCPASLLDQNKICVYECDFEAHQKIGNRCIECLNGNCASSTAGYKLCDLTKIDKFYPKDNRKYSLNKQTLTKLTNCTLILGDLDIDDNSFDENGVTLPLLYQHLKNVREIIGLFSLVTFRNRVSNLTFLSNLEEIRLSVKSHTVASAMSIYGKYIEFLGLKKLKKVYGKISIGGTNETCYLDRIPWKEISPDNRVKVLCNKTCHPLCTGQCWGPGNEMCFSCSYNIAGNSCVKQCSDSPGYFASQTEFKTIKCQTCHHLCKGNCTGPTPKNCSGQCRYAIEENTCVRNCSADFFPVTNVFNESITCQRCHNSCFVDKNLAQTNHACSGPSNILGAGGCSKCEKLIKTRNNQYICHKGSCPQGFYQSVINRNISHLHKDIVHQSSCEPCNSMCGSCSGPTNDRRVCHKCKGFFLNDRCVSECDNQVKNITVKLEIGADCLRCHKECRNGCILTNDSTTCNRCFNYKVFLDESKTKFSCVTRCPHDRNFTEYQDGNFLCLKFEETINSKQRKTIFIIFSGCLVFVVFAIVVCVLYFRWRANQTRILAEIKALYSNFKEPDMKNMKEDCITRPPNMRRLQMIPISDLVFDTSSKPLGSGAFGKVYRGYWKVPRIDNKYINLEVVIKIIHNSSKGSTDEFLEEAKIMASVSHRHCLPLIGVCLSLEKPCLVSTFAEHGSLDKYLHQNSKKISSHSMLKWAKQIADGMAYLNKRGIIHRDLAARNVLVNDDDNIQITDFGLARLVDETDDSIIIKSGKVPIRWLAIETLLSATYSPSTDVWAYGVTLWEIFTYGKRPYEELDTGEIKLFLQQGNRLCQPEISTLEVYMVMIKCWLDDPHMRPSFMELVSTFEQFIQYPKRFLYLPHEYINQQFPKDEDQKEMIQLNQISIDSDFRPLSIRNNKSDETSWAAALQNDSAYHLINNSYSKENEKSFLPKRKKAKRNISLERIKNFSKFDLNKILSPKSHRESKNFNYQHSSTYDSNKTTCTSIDSTNPFSSQRSNEYDSQPINPQIAKLKKELRHNNSLFDGSSKPDNIFKIPERIFIDKSLKEETEHLLQSPESRSPSLPPVEVPHVFPRSNPQFESVKSSVGNRIENSPDSGNSHNFDIDDYLVPSRISSSGYYNLTPSPSSNVKHSMNLEDVPLAVLNKEYVDDDGYLEPKKFDR